MFLLIPTAACSSNKPHKSWKNSRFFSLCQDAVLGVLGGRGPTWCKPEMWSTLEKKKNYTNTIFVISSLLYLPKHKPKPKHRKPVKDSDISKIL